MPEYNPIQINFNDKPRAILLGIEENLAQQKKVEDSYQRFRRLPLFIFLGGIPFACIDLFFMVAGYSMIVFSCITGAAWITALVVFLQLRRQRKALYAPQFDTAREIIHTLRDDIDPRRALFGFIDLTGERQPKKLVRETPNALGLVTQLYRDEWLNLKAKLYDGNMLRVSVLKRVKMRKGYWKRSRISGKNKWKPDKFKSQLHEIRVRLSVNPELYEIIPQAAVQPGSRMGSYSVTNVDTSGGIITLEAASAAQDVSAAEILAILKSTYQLLQRRSLA